jgi:fucose permease
MEVYYHLGYAVISLVFVGNAAGFIVAAFFTHTILDRLGRAKTLILSELIILSAYIMLVVTPPYPVVVVAFFLLGYGIAINLALNNVFCANLNPSSTVLGAAHGSYGVGGIVAPIIGTVMVSKGGLWSRFYFFPLGLRFFCIALAGWAFWSYDEDSSKTLMTALERTASRQAAAEPKLEKVKNLKSALMNKVTIFGALFIFAYQGAEVSISGWVISFLINYRNGDPASVGYVTSGFWVSPTSRLPNFMNPDASLEKAYLSPARTSLPHTNLFSRQA